MSDLEDKAEEQRLEKGKVRKLLFLIGLLLCTILLAADIVTILNVVRLNVLSGKLLALLVTTLIFILVILVVLNRWIVSGIVSKVLSLCLIVLLIIANRYMQYTYNRLNDMTDIKTIIDDMHVYVMEDDSARSVQDAEAYTFGRLSTLDKNNTDTYIASIEDVLGVRIECREYEAAVDLVKALYDGEVGAIIMNSAYTGIVTGVDEFKDFERDTRIIDTLSIENEVCIDEEVNEAYLYNGDRVFTIYISGIDTRGSSPKVNSNSDVNILLTANLDTRQVLLISTPRDFYVPLSISNGIRDKLTHAGGYGIDVSMDTLEMLYGVNIDDYLKINFTGFVDVIDELGGVEVYSDYDFSTKKNSFRKGYNSLNGEEALAFARERYSFSDGDRQRGKNQMAVIEAIIKKMASSDMLENYTDILDSLADCIVTSMTHDEITELVKFQLNDMSGWDVQKYSVNGFDSSNTTYSVGSMVLYVMVPDDETVEQAKEYLRQIYAGETVQVKK